MNMMHFLSKLILKPMINVIAHDHLIGRNRLKSANGSGLTGSDVDRFIKQTWFNFDEMAPSLPTQPNLGSRITVTLSCLTISMYKAMLNEGIEKDQAIKLIADIVWIFYKKWGVIPRIISRILTRDAVKRIRICTNLFRRFPFSPPGYLMEELPGDDMVAFNVRRCPTAEYFRSLGLGELCVNTWCNQDYALARMWGGELERSKTIAAGSEYCDFRWKKCLLHDSIKTIKILKDER